MSESLTFLHASDLHIGAPFRGLRALSPRWADRLMEAIPEAWERVVEMALARNVAFVVVSGDIFDSARASYRDYLRFFQGLSRLDEAGIPSYLCTGNHDPLSLWQQDFFALPERATMLAADRPDFALFEREGFPRTIIGGRGYPNKVWSPHENIAAGITRAAAIRALGPRAAEAPFAVGVLHTGLCLDTVKAPSDPTELLRAGFDYWALGHIHQPWVNDERAPRLVFSGCIQGRDIRETGPRGAYVVTLKQDGPPSLEFVPAASVVWERLTIDVSDCANIPLLINKVMRELFAVNGEAACEEMVTRITLVGQTPLHEVLGRPGVLEDVRAALNDAYTEFYCDALIDATRPDIDIEALKAEGLFPAVFMRAAQAMREDTAAEVAYLQEEFLQRNVSLSDPFSARRVDELAREAERLVLDLLIQGDEG